MTHTLAAIICSIFIIISCTNACALSSDDHNLFLKSSPAYANADKRLNDVWRALKSTLPKEEYSRLLTEQRNWLKNERDKQASLSEVSPRADAYAAVIVERAEGLEKRYNIKQLQTMNNRQSGQPDASSHTTLPQTPKEQTIPASQPEQTATPYNARPAGQPSTQATQAQDASAQVRQRDSNPDMLQKADVQGDTNAKEMLTKMPVRPATSGQETASASGANTAPPFTGKTYTNSIGMEFVLIPAGSFLLKDEVIKQNEFGEVTVQYNPEVIISKPFYLGKYEVTQEQWVAVMGKESNPAKFKGRTRPVEMVSWNDVQEFIRRLNAKEGRNNKNYRLPTEMEWEHASKAGIETGLLEFFDPDGFAELLVLTEKRKQLNTKYKQDPLVAIRNPQDFQRIAAQDIELSQKIEKLEAGIIDPYYWYRTNSGGQSHPVGQKKPNAYGLYDMWGNVWEWVQDWYAEKFPTERTIRDYHGPVTGRGYVQRGGSWTDYNQFARRHVAPNYRSDDAGFRVVILTDDARQAEEAARMAEENARKAAEDARMAEESARKKAALNAAGFIALSDTAMSWDDARTFCQSKGGRLPQVDVTDGSARLTLNGRRIDGFGASGASWPAVVPTVKDYYWTDTAYPGSSDAAFVIYNYNNSVTLNGDSKVDAFRTYAACVP